MARKKNDGYSYRPTSNGKIECRAYFDMPNNERKQLSARGTTESIARKNLTAKYKKICLNEEKIKSSNYTVEKWFNYWLYSIMRPVFEAKGSDTTSWYRRLSRRFIPVIGKIKLKDLKISNIQSVVNKMLQEDLSSKYIKEVVCLLATCLNYAHNEKLMDEIDFSNIKRPKLPKNKKIKIRDDDENKILSEYFSSSDFDLKYLPIKVMFDLGLRPEEVGGLNFGDLNYTNATISIERAFIIRDLFDENGKKIGREKILKDTKTEDGNRVLPIPTLKKNFKEQQLLMQSKYYSVEADMPIFRNCRGGRYNQETLRDLYKKLATELHITEMGSYTLRHGFCSKIITLTDIETTRTLMGQSDIKITQNYMHTSDNRKNEAMKKFSEATYNQEQNIKDNILPTENIIAIYKNIST